MADTFLCELGIKRQQPNAGKTWGVAYDNLQWVIGPVRVETRNGRTFKRLRQAISFHLEASSLRRDIKRYKIELSEEGAVFMKTLPEDFAAWRRYTLPMWRQLHPSTTSEQENASGA